MFVMLITFFMISFFHRAECLKGVTQTKKPPASPQLSHTRPYQAGFSMGPLGFALRDEEPSTSPARRAPATSPSGPPAPSGGGGGGGGYSKEELQVLRYVLGIIFSSFERGLALKHYQIDGLVQERRNSSALAMELLLSCTNPSKCVML